MIKTVQHLQITLDALKEVRTRWVYFFAGRTDAEQDGDFEKLTAIQSAITAFEAVIALGVPQPAHPSEAYLRRLLK